MIYRIALIVGLLVLSGCGPSKEEQANDACIRGIYHAQQGEHNKAIASFTEAIQLNSKDADAYNNRGGVYVYKREYDKAISDFTEAIRLNPKYAEAYVNRGIAYRNKGEQAKAEADFAKAKELGYNPE